MTKHLVVNDKNKRYLVNKQEIKQMVYKSLYNNSYISLAVRKHAYLKVMNMVNNSYRTRVQNRCVYTGRSGAVTSRFKVTRMQLKRLVYLTHLNGIVRKTW